MNAGDHDIAGNANLDENVFVQWDGGSAHLE